MVLFNFFQLCLEADFAGSGNAVVFYNEGAFYLIDFQYSTLAHDGVAYAVTDSKACNQFYCGHITFAGTDKCACFVHKTAVKLRGILQQFSVYVENKAGGIAETAVMIAPLCVGKIQSLFGSSLCDECKTALFLHALSGSGFFGGEGGFVETANENVGKFKTLGGVDGHQLNCVLTVGSILV